MALICCALVALSPAWVAAACGDGIVEVGECCDDGNLVVGDGCDDCACPMADHLKCYKMKDAIKLFGNVDLHSPQFGLEAGCTVKKANKFCVPVRKVVNSVVVDGVTVTPENIGGQNLVNDYICYRIKCSPPAPAETTVADQFGTRTLSKFTAYELCTPTTVCPDEGTINISTGQLILTPAGMSDPLPWYVSAVPDGTLNTPPPPPHVAATVIDPNGAWATLPDTQWVSANTECTDSANGSCPIGQYSYEICWKQCGAATIDLQVLAANSATLYVNDVAIYQTLVPGYATFTSGVIPDPGPGVRNCLRFDVQSSSTCNNPSAEPCTTDLDCPDPAGPIGPVCGGNRCIGGGNAGSPCSVSSTCPGGTCGSGSVATGLDVQGSITGSVTLVSPL